MAEPIQSGGLRAYARHRKQQGLPGTSHAAVRKAIDAGRISPPGPSGALDFARADAEWAANTNEKHQTRPGNPSIRPADRPHVNGSSDPPVHGSAGDVVIDIPDDLRALGALPERGLIERIKLLQQAHKAQIEARRAAGDLLPRDEVEREVQTYFRALRDTLQGLPASLAHQLAELADPVACRELLEQEIDRILDEPAIDYESLQEAAA